MSTDKLAEAIAAAKANVCRECKDPATAKLNGFTYCRPCALAARIVSQAHCSIVVRNGEFWDFKGDKLFEFVRLNLAQFAFEVTA